MKKYIKINVKITSNNNKNEENSFSGLEIRNNNTNGISNNNKQNGFIFIKGKTNKTEDNSNNDNIMNQQNKDLLNIFGNNEKPTSNTTNNNIAQKQTENNTKQGFTFIKSAKLPLQPQNDDLDNVFQTMNIVNKDKKPEENVSKSKLLV